MEKDTYHPLDAIGIIAESGLKLLSGWTNSSTVRYAKPDPV